MISPPLKYPRRFCKSAVFEIAVSINCNKPGFHFHLTEIFFYTFLFLVLLGAEVSCASGVFVTRSRRFVSTATRERGMLSVRGCTCTHGRRTCRLLDKQGDKNCRRAGGVEVEMTDNYTSFHVCDESVATACLFVKQGWWRRGCRLSLRGSASK